MKIFVFLFLVTFCQAGMEEKDEEVFHFLSNLNTNKMIETFENEINQLMEQTLTPKEMRFVRELAKNFSTILREEFEKVLFTVTESGNRNRQFTIRTFANLRQAADSIANGLNMTEAMLDKFVQDLMADIVDFEESGLLDLDLDSIFNGVAERALMMLQEKKRDRRDIGSVLHEMNDTLGRILGTMTGKFQDLQDFYVTSLKLSTDKIQPYVKNMKILATHFISNIKTAQASVLEHAIEFFTPFAVQMGDTYVMLMNKAQERLKKLSETPIPAIYK